MAGTRMGVVGCGGRMGRMLLAEIAATEGCSVAGGCARSGSAHVNHDLGELAGHGHDSSTALDPAPTADQKKAILALARDRTYFVSQHHFFCHLIEQIDYSAVTPDPTNVNRQRVIDALLESNALWYPLRYPAEYAGGGTI